MKQVCKRILGVASFCVLSSSVFALPGPCGGVTIPNYQLYRAQIFAKQVTFTSFFIETEFSHLKHITKLLPVTGAESSSVPGERFTKLYEVKIKGVNVSDQLSQEDQTEYKQFYADFATHMALYEHDSRCYFAWIKDAPEGACAEPTGYLGTSPQGEIVLTGGHEDSVEEEMRLTPAYIRLNDAFTIRR